MGSEATEAIALASERGLTVATAESLTGGKVCEALVEVPGASRVVRGGVVAYVVEVKHEVLGVAHELLDTLGPVSEPVALAMARGARRLMSADVAVATTGVAGPQPHGGQAPGTVVVAAVGPENESVTTFHLEGNRDDVRRESTRLALIELRKALSP